MGNLPDFSVKNTVFLINHYPGKKNFEVFMSPVLIGLVPGIVTGLCSSYILLQHRDEKNKLYMSLSLAPYLKAKNLEYEWLTLHPSKKNEGRIIGFGEETTFSCLHDKEGSALPGKEACEEKKRTILEVYVQNSNFDLSAADRKLFWRTANLVISVVLGVFLALRLAPAFVAADSAAYRAFRTSASLSAVAGVLIIPGSLCL